MKTEDIFTRQEVINERSEILNRLEGRLETPMIVLGFLWLALLIIELHWDSALFGDAGDGDLGHLHHRFCCAACYSHAQTLLPQKQLADEHCARRPRAENPAHSIEAANIARGFILAF